jgi:hypothetical protein
MAISSYKLSVFPVSVSGFWLGVTSLKGSKGELPVSAAHSRPGFFQGFWPSIQVRYLFSYFQFLVSGFSISKMRQNGLV